MTITFANFCLLTGGLLLALSLAGLAGSSLANSALWQKIRPSKDAAKAPGIAHEDDRVFLWSIAVMLLGLSLLLYALWAGHPG
jgi:hypothetical protein